eukprot:3796688-Amphidinium_carterae.2
MITPTRRALDVAFEGQPDGITGKKKKVSATENEVHRATKQAIRESCRWAVGDDDIYSRVVNGQTLWQRVYADKYAAMVDLKPITFGKMYYQTLRALYENPDSADQRLERPEEGEESAEFMIAMVQLFKHPPNRSYLKSFAENQVDLSHSDAVGCCRCLLRLEATASVEQRDLCVSLLRALGRSGSFTTHPELADIMHARVDKILVAVMRLKRMRKTCQARVNERVTKRRVASRQERKSTVVSNHKVYNSSRSSDETPAAWLDRMSPLWETVLPPAAVRKVLAVDESKAEGLDSVATELDECLAASHLGTRLFGFALQNVLNKRIRETITSGLETLKQKDHVQRSDVVKCRKDIAEKIRALGSIDALAERRKVDVHYRGVTFTIATKSWTDEVDKAVDIAVRGWMAELKKMDALVGEDLICVPTSGLLVKEFGADLLKDARASRKFVRSLGAKEKKDRSAEKLEVCSGDCPRHI